MRKAGYIFVAVCILAVLSVTEGCKKENMCDCLKRTGDVITETRSIDAFTEIFVEDKVNVILTEDSTLPAEVMVEAGDKLIPLIRTEVIDGVLRIRNDNRCDFTRSYDVPVNVYVRCTSALTLITNKGTGDITNTGTCTAPYIDLQAISAGNIRLHMDAGSVYTHQHSVGDVEVTGNAGEVIVYNTGNGFTIADACEAPYCWVYTRSTGKITLFPTSTLISEIEGPGNVYYKGQPAQITSILHSTGLLLPL
jgi:hypothetical protein